MQSSEASASEEVPDTFRKVTALSVGFRGTNGEQSEPFGRQVDVLSLYSEGTTRFGITGGVGSGKTDAAIARALRDATENALACPGSALAIYGPTVGTTRRVPLTKLLRCFPAHHPGQAELAKIDGRELSPAIEDYDHDAKTIILKPELGSMKILYGSFDSAKAGMEGRDQGWDCGVMLIVEAQQLDRGQRQRLISRCRENVPNRTIILEGLSFCGTAHEQWCKAENVRWIRFRTEDNPHLPADYIDQLLPGMTEAERMMYLEGEFVPQSGRVISGYEPELGKSLIPYTIDPSREVRLAWDFGYNRPAVALLQLREGSNWRKDQWVICHEWARSNLSTEALAIAIRDELGDMGLADSLTRIVCDPAGKARSSVAGTRTDVTELRRIFPGVKVQWPRLPRLLIIQESCKILNRLFLAADGQRRILVADHLAAPEHLDNLQRVKRAGVHQSLLGYGFPDLDRTPRADPDEPVKDGIHDHFVDLLRYAAVTWRAQDSAPRKKREPLPDDGLHDFSGFSA